jgi:4-amino-4-deoxy-L-arabinose transferase-like glycosyltransferase
MGMGMGTVVLLTLLLHYIPGPFPTALLVAAINALTLALGLLGLRSSEPDLRLDSGGPAMGLGILVLLLAALLRIPHLGYSEFQGDEATIMMRTAFAISGDDARLFYHQKGPIELLIPTATWALSGVINEWQARLPFAFASILGVVAIYLLGRRWVSERGGLIAALLVTINGYFVGFGRIVQYQSLVLAMTGLGLLALWRWSVTRRPRWLAAGAALLALGLLAHYDAGLALPAAGYLVGRQLWVDRESSEHSAPSTRALVTAGAAGLGILALFYVPFVLHPNFSKTLGYLGGARLGAGKLLYNNLSSSLGLGTFYNSTYYLGCLALTIVLASFLAFRRLKLIPVACYLLSALLPAVWTGPILAALLVAVLISSDSPASRAAWLWFGIAFLFYFFLVWDPRTHVLNAFPGAALLAASVVDRLMSSAVQSTRRLVSAALVATFLFLAYYPYLMFVRHDPEIKRTWPDHYPALYWRPNIEVPRYGYFGFPYRTGWKTVGVLVQQGVVDGVYASNEEQEITDWYVRGAERTYCRDPEWYFVAEAVQDRVPIPEAEIQAAYDLWGRVQVAGRTTLRICRRKPVTASPTTYPIEDAPFDAHTSPEKVVPSPPADYARAGHTLAQTMRLLGYRVDASEAHAGGSLRVVLYWSALQPIEANYQVFTHLYDERLWGQHDGAPACAMQPTSLWEPGRIVRDEHLIPVDPSTPAGDIPLLVGMYSLETKERLPVQGPNGEPLGDMIHLETIRTR